MEDKNFENFINQDFGSLSSWLFALNPYEFTFVATLIGFVISPNLTIDQQNSLGNFFELLGQVILTINAQGATLNKKIGNNQKATQLSNMEEDILNIKQEINRLRHVILNNSKE